MAENVIITQRSDVGELLKLLPSDIFPLDQDSVSEVPKNSSSSSSSSSNDHHRHHHHHHHHHQLPPCMAEDGVLTQRAGARSVLEPTPPKSSNLRIPLPPNYEWVRYDVPCITVGPIPPPPGVLPLWCLVYDASSGGVHGVFDGRTGSFKPALIPIYTCPVYVPVQTNSVGGSGGGGNGVQQNNNQASNRRRPHPGGRARNGVGSTRINIIDSGTGVYLPRKIAGSSSTAANNNTAAARKRQGAGNKAQFLPKKMSTTTPNPVEDKKQEADCLDMIPPEFNLPQEWTY